MIIKRELKSGQKTFMARFTGSDGKYHHKTFHNMKDATCWEIQANTQKNDKHFALPPENITAKEYFDFYLELLSIRLEAATMRRYYVDITKYILPIIKDKKVREIRLEDALDIQKYLSNKGLDPNTNNKAMYMLIRIIKHASHAGGKDRLIKKYPLEGLKLLPLARKEILIWNKEEIAYFFNHEVVKGSHYYDFMRFAVNTGMRLGEIAGLQVKKVHILTNTITISNELKGWCGGYVLGKLRCAKIRDLRMNPVVIDIVKKRIKGQDQDQDKYIFYDQGKNYLNVDRFCSLKFKPLQRKIGVRKILQFKDLRHVYAAHFLGSGGSLIGLKEILGHKYLESTLFYCGLAGCCNQQEANRMEVE